VKSALKIFILKQLTKKLWVILTHERREFTRELHFDTTAQAEEFCRAYISYMDGVTFNLEPLESKVNK
jgi:hypothetical protein